MKMYDEAMDMWAAGGTTTSIAEALGINRGTVSNILIRARREEDKRAIPRKRGRKKNVKPSIQQPPQKQTLPDLRVQHRQTVASVRPSQRSRLSRQPLCPHRVRRELQTTC